MSEDRALRLRKWVRFGDTVTITLTHSPAGDGPEAERLHRAVGAFVHALSASPDQAAGLSREDVARLIDPSALWECAGEPGVVALYGGRQSEALAKADQIIAAFREAGR